MLTADSFREARTLLRDVLVPTPLVYSDHYSALSGNNVYLKPENLQVTGAYKVRGAYYKISRLSTEQKERGLIAASAGNHAQGVAYAARAAGAHAVIVMPKTAPLVKVDNTKRYGAEVILYGNSFDECNEYAKQLAEEKGYTFIPPFDDLAVATGQGTIAYEIFKDLPDVDVILVPVGGGGLATGVAALTKLLNPLVKVIGVEPRGAASLYESLKSGAPVTLERTDTIADGVAVKTPGAQLFPHLQKNLDDVILIDDSELVETFLDVMEKHKLLVENSGLLTVAALRHLGCKDQNVVSVLSGGNIDVITIASMIQHGLQLRGRVFTFSVRIPDRPGELRKVVQRIADSSGNIIKLEHNQLINLNRQNAVEVRVTLETFGNEHKARIMEDLRAEGFAAELVPTTGDGV